MNDNATRRRIKPLPLAVLIIGSIGFIWIIINLNASKMEQNIYFIESDGADTVIFKYDSRKGKLIELDKVSGTIKNCVIGKEETRITGFLIGPISEGRHRIAVIEYDIKTGMVTEKMS